MSILNWIIVLFGLFFSVWCWKFSYWRRQKVLSVAFQFPYFRILGNLLPGKNEALQFADFYKSHRTDYPIMGIYTLFKAAVLIVDLSLIRRILNEKFSHFQDRGMFYNENDPLSTILGTLDYHKWKPVRAKLTPAFTQIKLKQMFDVMKTVGDGLVVGLNQKIIIDNDVEIRDLFSRFAIDVIGKVAIGIDCSTLNSSTELREMLQKAMQPYLKFPLNILTTTYPVFARWLGIRKHPKIVSDFFVNVVDQIIQHRTENNERRNDYMQLLIDSGLQTNQIAALAFDLLSAGYADSTSTLSYCLYELALNKNIQAIARDEIRSVLKQNDGQLTYDVLQQMVYCEQVINETLRMHPVAGKLMRITTKPYKIDGTEFTIPKGMRVYIPIYAIHHDERYYSDPEEFKPERMSTENKKILPPGAFLPFGEGPRHCIGFGFAKLLIKIGLVSLLRNFEYSTCDRTQIPIEYSPTKNTLIPEAGVWLNVHRIST